MHYLRAGQLFHVNKSSFSVGRSSEPTPSNVQMYGNKTLFFGPTQVHICKLFVYLGKFVCLNLSAYRNRNVYSEYIHLSGHVCLSVPLSLSE